MSPSCIINNNNNYNNIIPQVRTDPQYNIKINTVHLQLDAGEETVAVIEPETELSIDCLFRHTARNR